MDIARRNAATGCRESFDRRQQLNCVVRAEAFDRERTDACVTGFDCCAGAGDAYVGAVADADDVRAVADVDSRVRAAEQSDYVGAFAAVD